MIKKVIKLIKDRRKFIVFSFLKIAILLLGLITNIFIVRKLTVENYGVFSIAAVLIGLLTTFGFSWSSSSILYFGSKEMEKYGSINKTFWARNIILVVSLFITTVLFVIFKNDINNYVGEDLAYLILLWLYTNIFEDYIAKYFLTINKQLISSLLSITVRILYIILILIFDFDVRTLIIFNIISTATVFLYLFAIDKETISKFEFDRDWFKIVFNFSIWQLFGFAGLYLINFGDMIVIKSFMGNRNVAIYNVAYKLFNAIATLSFVISSYYASRVSKYFTADDGEKIHKFYYNDRKVILILSFVIHLLVIFLSKYIITFLYGVEYKEAYKIFNILMIGSFVKYITVFYMLYYNSTGKHKVLQLVNIGIAVVNLSLDVILIQIFKLHGPAIATTISIFLGLFFSYWYCEKKIKSVSKV